MSDESVTTDPGPKGPPSDDDEAAARLFLEKLAWLDDFRTGAAVALRLWAERPALLKEHTTLSAQVSHLRREVAEWQHALDTARRAAVEIERTGVRVMLPGRP